MLSPSIGFAQARRVDHVAALYRIGFRRKRNGLAVSAGDCEVQVVRVVGREGQWGAVDGQHQGRAAHAEYFFRIDRVQRRKLRRFHRRQGDDQHRHGAVERGSRVQGERNLVALVATTSAGMY